MVSRRKGFDDIRPAHPPAKTPEGREQQLIGYAINLAEQQLVQGTAPVAVITHYLKLATEREKSEREKLRQEVELLKKKIEAEESAKNVEALYSEALNAMRSYTGMNIEIADEE